MPGTKDVGANIAELNASPTKRPRAQKVAIALSEARKAGANIPPPKSKPRKLREAYGG
jgi:hypothetical protein